MATHELTLTARCLFPVDGSPCAGGTVTIAEGKLVAVEPRGTRTADVDLGNVALLPGLVNAHTHLDLTGLRGRCPPSPDFIGWLRKVIAYRASTTPEQTQADIHAGIDECVRYGTTLIGDIASGGTSWNPLAEAPLRAVVFHELTGLARERRRQALADAQDWLASHRPRATSRPALSPHAPYSVSSRLFNLAIRLARDFGSLVAVHLAETRAERELLAKKEGPFVTLLKDLGVWAPHELVQHPEDVLRIWRRRRIPKLYIHGNYLRPEADVTPMGTIVYCPRTHAAFGHPPHPFRDFLARGVRIALGTDGLSSNPDLDLLAEARFIHRRHPDFPGDALLRMATLAGAEALGWADETGSLTPGKSADLVAVPLPDAEGSDPYHLLFASEAAVCGVMIQGTWVRPPEARRGHEATSLEPPPLGS